MTRTVKLLLPAVPPLKKRKRVAAYARVSSEKEVALESLSAQVSHYSKYIQKHGEWKYSGVYADEATTGTKDSRIEFQRLLSDCRQGRIDLILTKSISRFARNTVILLNTIRELRDLGIDVYFERENIHSMSGDGELMLTILASYAQEESLSASLNCKWRIRRQFQQGQLANWRFMYGYRVKADRIEIDNEQADVVKNIFADYVSGEGCGVIAQKLRRERVPPMRDGQWTAKRVMEVLKNEKYTGNALLQKRYVKDHLSKALVRNNGELSKYYAVGTHDAIIDQATFDRAQVILDESRKRGADRYANQNRYPFSGIIRCPKCGKNYKRDTLRGKAYWNCSTLLDFGRGACFGKRIPEDVLMILVANVLKMPEFDEKAFKRMIKEIIIPAPNKVYFTLTDGRTVLAEWRDRPRCESWTEEMRRDAANRAAERWRKAK